MTFHAIQRSDVPAGCSPIRLVDEQDREIEWANRFLDAQCVRGKGARVRLLPLPPETIRLLHCYLKTERPLTNAPEVLVSLKGRARGAAMTPAGLRSLFRHHRSSSGIRQANPHRFPPYLWIGYDSRWRQPARADAPDGTRPIRIPSTPPQSSNDYPPPFACWICIASRIPLSAASLSGSCYVGSSACAPTSKKSSPPSPPKNRLRLAA